MVDLFETVRESVTAKQAAEMLGFAFRRGRIKCPFHGGEHHNLSFHGGGFMCFVCGEKGSSIDFVAKLYNLSPIEAVRKIDSIFNLSLPLDERMNKKEYKQQCIELRHRDELKEYIGEFEKWVDGAYRAIAEIRTLYRSGTYRPPSVSGRQAAEFLALYHMTDWLFDLLSECRNVETQAGFYANHHKTIQKMQDLLHKKIAVE